MTERKSPGERYRYGKTRMAECMNILAEFCGGRDVPDLMPASGIYGSPARTARIMKTCGPFSATLSGRRKLQ